MNRMERACSALGMGAGVALGSAAMLEYVDHSTVNLAAVHAEQCREDFGRIAELGGIVPLEQLPTRCQTFAHDLDIVSSSQDGEGPSQTVLRMPADFMTQTAPPLKSEDASGAVVYLGGFTAIGIYVRSRKAH